MTNGTHKEVPVSEASVDSPVVAPNADLVIADLQAGRFTIKPLTLKIVILLEKIQSPFVRQATIDPATGEPLGVQVTMEDVARALYIMINADDPTLVDTINDRVELDRCVMALAEGISLEEMHHVNRAISNAMKTANRAAEEAGLGKSGKSEPTGPGQS